VGWGRGDVGPPGEQVGVGVRGDVGGGGGCPGGVGAAVACVAALF